MPRGEKLFRFLAKLMLQRFYGTVIIRFESGKVTHVEMETRRAWRYRDLPEDWTKCALSSARQVSEEPESP